MKTKQLLLNAPLRKRLAGAVVDVVFKDGIAVDPYWRSRLLDAERDGCVEIIPVKKTPAKPLAKDRETKVTGPDETKLPNKFTNKTPEKKG
jgi:hypothetical protein